MTGINTLSTDTFTVSYEAWRQADDQAMGGAQPPLVLVHSGGASPAQWRPLMADLAEIRPDRPIFAPALVGYVGTGRHDGSAATAKDDGPVLVAFLRAIAPGRAVDLVGHSYGGVTAIAAALAMPEAIRSLTLIEPVCFDVLAHTGADRSFQTIAAFGHAQIDLVAAGEDRGAAQAFVTFWNGPQAWQSLTEARRAALSARMPKVASEWQWILTGQTDLTALKRLRTLHLICGAQTHPVARSVFDALCSALPDAEQRIIPEAGHMAPMTHARQLGPVLTEGLGIEA
ncbi:alpha/beta fold hydrolase [Marinobacter caseinilyticus]|uniref:alpha/beta fold hydrolase n=1 Tax=Marinobacter caseinilyticus TaxID=2692195 RepID=UPI0014073446|nr:alpha/beta fold hydrolase [Marinobacter caseinilyticus]